MNIIARIVAAFSKPAAPRRITSKHVPSPDGRTCVVSEWNVNGRPVTVFHDYEPR